MFHPELRQDKTGRWKQDRIRYMKDNMKKGCKILQRFLNISRAF